VRGPGAVNVRRVHDGTVS